MDSMDLFGIFKSRSRLFGAILVILIAIGTVGFRIIEDWTWVQSFYFTVSTLTTVGYGDLVPTSDGSRLAASIFMLFGILAFITLLSLLESRFFGNHASKKTPEEQAEAESPE